MRNRSSGIKIYRAGPEERRRNRGSLSLFLLQAAAMCFLMIAWWNAFLSVFRLPLHTGWLYGGTVAAVLLLGTVNRRFGARAVGAGLAVAAILLWYGRDLAINLYEWIGQNYETLFSAQPAGQAAYSYASVLISVPVLELLLCVQRTGRGKAAAGLVICAPFITAACAGWFQTVLPSWLLIMGAAAYYASSVSGAGRTGRGLFMWRHALLTMAVCSVLAILSFQAGKRLDVGREAEDSFYFRMRGTITTEVVGGIEDLMTAVTGEDRTEEAAEEENTGLADDETLEGMQQDENIQDEFRQDDIAAEEAIQEDITAGSVFDSPSYHAESDTVNLGSIARFEPSTAEMPEIRMDRRPESTVYVAENLGGVYSDNSWNMTDTRPSDEECREYPAELEETLAALCGSWADGSFEEVRQGISRELTSRAVYDTAPGATPAGEDFVEYFLFENHKGFCVHFATAATLMYRYCGYTARYAEGYAIPASAFHEDETGGYVAQITGNMGHAWCQVYDEQTGEWLDMEHTPPAPADTSGAPPAASSDYEETIREKVVYEILPVLLPVCLTVFLCAVLFFGQAALRSARREQRFRKKKDGEGIREMYAAVLKTAKFQGVEIKEPLAEDMAEQLYTEYPELEEKEWEWMYNRAMESMFYHLDHEKNDWAKMRTLYTRFRKAALGRMSRGQRWRFRYVYCL